MSPFADMLIRQHDNLSDALRHAALMEQSLRGSKAHAWYFAACEIREAINSTTIAVTAEELLEVAHFITATEDAKPSVYWRRLAELSGATEEFQL